MGMTSIPEPLPADLAEAHAMILAERAAHLAAEAEAATAKETKRLLDLEIERLKLEITRLKRHRFGTSSERSWNSWSWRSPSWRRRCSQRMRHKRCGRRNGAHRSRPAGRRRAS